MSAPGTNDGLELTSCSSVGQVVRGSEGADALLCEVLRTQAPRVGCHPRLPRAPVVAETFAEGGSGHGASKARITEACIG